MRNITRLQLIAALSVSLIAGHGFAQESSQVREQRFLSERNLQEQKLDKLEQQLKTLEDQNQNLRSEQSNNTRRIQQLEEQKESQLANRGHFLNSLNQEFLSVYELARTLPVTALSPGRLQQFHDISRQQELPSPEKLLSAIAELQSLVLDTGLAGPAEVSVVQPNGSELVQTVTFAGPFAVNNHGNFLVYQPGRDRLLTAPRQPDMLTRIYAAGFRGSRGDAMAIDPEHGQILQRMASEPTVFDQINNGGTIAWLILLLAMGGMFVTLKRLSYLNGEALRIYHQQANLETLTEDNALGRILMMWKTASNSSKELRLKEALMVEIPKLERGHSLVRLIAILVPMLGLLGTIAGMIATFQTLNFAAGREQLMASDIAQALVTTAAGLLAAIPLLAGHGLLTSRSKRIILTLDKQAASMLADYQEQQAVKAESQTASEKVAAAV
ncbi:MotA/TolQ/ExbB proton channel family protein [Sansalvadorimonas verongulae]|uniref:MotA/TolQ/ExbB proton channel family protein n=1 Tax=Sansalvadorimonas verongulae TaxID=2172824 RepID=UPI0012BBA8AB|nr:MotA/TolQ/ExbB proton channel family protein [Sansalvadorimonas verongulae]MTI14703.1 hypothetical protein [Sansalvadorimonas verongulae]